MQMRAKHKSKVASKMDLPATDHWLPVFDVAIESVRPINIIFNINNIHEIKPQSYKYARLVNPWNTFSGKPTILLLERNL